MNYEQMTYEDRLESYKKKKRLLLAAIFAVWTLAVALVSYATYLINDRSLGGAMLVAGLACVATTIALMIYTTEHVKKP